MLADIISGERCVAGTELAHQRDMVGAALQAAGLGPGDTIALLLHNDIAFVELMLGADQAGVTAVPLNWHAAQAELEHIITDSAARLIFVHANLLPKLDWLTADKITIITIATPPEVAAALHLQPQQCLTTDPQNDYQQWLKIAQGQEVVPQEKQFQLLYTSGSTGMPKGVLRRRGQGDVNQRFAQIARLAHGLEVRPIRAVMTGPLYHSAPNSYALNTIRFGELLVLQPKFDAAQLLELVAQHRISHLHMVPTMFRRLLDLPAQLRAQADTSSLRSVTHGSSRCDPQLKQAMIDWWGPIFYEYYASTETGIITMIDSQQWAQRPGSVGKPHPAVKIRVVDEQGAQLDAGLKGEVQIKSEVTGLIEYHNMPAASAQFVRDGWANTGDIGYLDEAGYLWLSDRKNDLIISGGVNIYPAEVERCLCTHPLVSDAIAFAIDDAQLGEAIGATVELAPNASVAADELRAYVRKQLGGLRTPRHIRVTQALNRAETGKLKRAVARTQFLEEINSLQAQGHG